LSARYIDEQQKNSPPEIAGTTTLGGLYDEKEFS
jgi:hypothetical protein